MKFPGNASCVLVALVMQFGVSIEGAKAQSAADCEAHARYSERSGGTVLGGAARGAARGALFGAIVGRGKGARRGAALGALLGGIKRSARRNDSYLRTYENCMAGRR